MRLLEGSEITKYFGGLAALTRVDFHVDEGEIVGLIGANGAGKTTLFNIISGVYSPNDGTLKLKGRPITGLRPYAICRRGITRTFQIVKPFSNMTVLNNTLVGVLFGRGATRSLAPARDEAMATLQFTGLADVAHLPARALTIANRKRLEISRALATRPELLLLDEVLAGLNPTETAQAMKLIRDIREQKRITVFMIEHVMKALMGLSDRVIVLHYGKVIAQGSPEAVSSDPAVIQAYLGRRTGT